MALWWLVMRKIIRISKTQPHHLARRLRLVALRQERAARRARHGHRGGRRRPVHRAAAQGGRRTATRSSSGYPEVAMPAQREAVPIVCRHRVLDGAAARHVHDPVRHAPPRRVRAPRGPGRGDRLRVAGEAGRVPRRRRLRHLRHLRRARRHLRARARAHAAARRAVRAAAAARPGATRAGRGSRVLSMLAIMFLPRQFQIAVVENVNENHLRQGDLAVPALHAGDERVRGAGRLRRRDALPAARRRPGHLRADAADGARSRRRSRCSCSSAACRPPPAW